MATLEIEIKNQIVILQLNRPAQFNAFNEELIVELKENLQLFVTDETVKAIIITGKGKAFCAGGDLKAISQQSIKASRVLYQLATTFHQAIIEIHKIGKPVIAAINGVAAGGGFSLALACDFRVMAKSAILKQAYTSSGLSIDGGGTFALPRLIGLAKSLEIIAFDKIISSEQALNWGLVTKIVDDDQVVQEAINMANIIMKQSLNSFKLSKNLLTNSFNTSLETQLEQERIGICNAADHPDGREGISAFVEKRKPDFNK